MTWIVQRNNTTIELKINKNERVEIVRTHLKERSFLTELTIVLLNERFKKNLLKNNIFYTEQEIERFHLTRV